MGNELKDKKSEAKDRDTYVIQKGDTLSEVASHHNIPMAKLQKDSGVKDPNVIIAGGELSIPSDAQFKAAMKIIREGANINDPAFAVPKEFESVLNKNASLPNRKRDDVLNK